ncbi:MAG: response regulator [Candidatus Omnitrophica bacterium]|nr:response regulator [Candidatus Omnitrophota bacterium]
MEKTRILNILLVEDNEADAKIALRAFGEAKVKNRIFVAKDGQEALEYLTATGKYISRREFPFPDIILLDINLPKLSGLELLKKIKSSPQLRAVPVVMLSSSEDEKDIRESYLSYASSYIRKPLGYDDFVKAIEIFNCYWNILVNLP